jgi:hypothetical protein
MFGSLEIGSLAKHPHEMAQVWQWHILGVWKGGLWEIHVYEIHF